MISILKFFSKRLFHLFDYQRITAKPIFIKSDSLKNKFNTKYLFLLVGILFISNVFSQVKNSTESKSRMQADLKILASDSLGGREAGSTYEILARNYIASSFKRNNLIPFFDGSYFQEFPFKDGADFSESFLTFNGKKYKNINEFQPLSKSKNDNVSGKMLKVGFGILSSSPSHNDYTNHNILDGKIFVIDISVPGGSSNYEKYVESADLDKRIEMAAKFGAKAVILINNDSSFNDPRKMISNQKGRTPIPVVFAKGALLDLINKSDSADISINIDIKKFDKQGYNVAGYIDNGSDKTIIIGGHYDHIGMGGETSRSTEAAIHNGADDNASGVALVIELAHQLKDKKLNSNILFLSFSAEEKGLYGSSYFVENSLPAIKNQTLCFINFDMVGRMDSAKSSMTVFGTGTANQWDTIMGSIPDENINITKALTGIGGSDQMPFYLDSVPVLFFFTGVHDDYHTPNDDEKFINYNGMERVLNYSLNLILEIDKQDSLSWKATKARTGSSGRSRGGLSMGIMPDYSTEGGVLVSMVIEGKPGNKAGLLKGDIIKRIDTSTIKDIYDYMDVLKTCKPNQVYDLEIMRNGEKMILKLQF